MKREPLYKKYADTKAIGVCPLSNFGGVELLDIINGWDDYAVACFNFGTGRQKIRRYKIQWTDSRNSVPYIKKEGVRYYINDTPNSAHVFLSI